MKTLIAILWGLTAMANPYLSRIVTVGDLDSLDMTRVVGRAYNLEWLRANYVANGGFETGDFTAWTAEGTTSVSAAAAHSGSYGAVFAASNDTPIITSGYIALPDQRWWERMWCSYWHRATSPLAVDYEPEIEYYDASLTAIGTQALPSDSTETSWAQKGAQLQMPDGAVYARIRVTYPPSGSGDLHLDDVMLVQYCPFLLYSSAAGPTWADWSVLTPGARETYTFPESAPRRLLRGRTVGTGTYRSDLGRIYSQRRYAALDVLSLTFGGLTRCHLDQLYRFAAKVDGRPCYYTDETGVETEGYMTRLTSRVQGKTGEYWTATFDFEERAD